MLLTAGIYRLDVDIDRTREFYASAPLSLGCDCAGCRNFEKAVSAMPGAARSLLTQLGIDPGKPAEISVLHSPDGKTTCYDGFYHICGTILKGREPFAQTGPKRFALKPEYLLEPEKSCSAYIQESCALVKKDFPRPVFQLNISFPLPWVLEEPNPYI